MASVEKVDPETATEKVASPLPPPKSEDAPPPPPPPSDCACMKVDVGLRVLLFASTLTALLVMVTSKQTVVVRTPLAPFPLALEAKFDQSPAFIYLVTALVVACLYSIVTALASISVILKPVIATSFLLFFLLWDVVMLGIVASATGAAGGVAYIGLKGNTHAQWGKVCPTYDKFCQHLGGSIFISLLAAFLLVFLIFLSIFSLHKKLPK